jgi:hypothetical protein
MSTDPSQTPPPETPSRYEGDIEVLSLEEQAAARQREDEAILERIKNLPPSMGATLMTGGFISVMLPGAPGAPLLLAGGLILAPDLFQKVDDFLKRKVPGVRHQGLGIMQRFLTDMARRFPDKRPGSQGT